jgi:hypothetical protein
LNSTSNFFSDAIMNSADSTDNSEPAQPDWNLLRHAPEEFFELQGDFDTRDLKRSYNRLLRRFKPEKFPQEFQKIRAAYELLNDNLRYKQDSFRRLSPNVFDWGIQKEPPKKEPKSNSNVPEPATNQETSTRTESSPAATPLVNEGKYSATIEERIESESLSSLARELEAKAHKSPREFYQLALLADILDPPDLPGQPAAEKTLQTGFEKWLLAGISQHPRDSGLLNLWREYLSSFAPIERLGMLLRESLNVLQTQRFFYVTEQAWDRFLQDCTSFAEFDEVLESCLQNSSLAADKSVVVFYLHLLKRALWKTDEDWIARKIEEVESQYFSLSNWQQKDFEVLVILRQYLSNRAWMLQRGVLAQAMDQAIQDWCTKPEIQADQAVLECQHLISSNGRRLLDEFPFEDGEHCIKMFPCWMYVVEDVRRRLAEPRIDVEDDARAHAINFVVRLTRRSERGMQSCFGKLLQWSGAVFAIYAMVIAIAFMVRMFIRLFSGMVLLGLLDIVWAGLLLVTGIVVFFTMAKVGLRIKMLPYATVRLEMLKLLRVVPLRMKALSDYINQAEDLPNESDTIIINTRHITHRIRVDVALEIYSLAQQCLNVEQE